MIAKSAARVRIDKWLWAARFFKTRALASKACDLGRVRANGVDAKPSREVKLNEVLQIKTEGGDFEVEVLALSDLRGPAALAQTLYSEPATSRQLRLQAAEERRAQASLEAARDGKPSKRDRREIDRFRGR